MTTRLSRRIQMAALIGSTLMLVSCATTTPQEPAKAVGQAPDIATQTTIAKGQFETPPEIHPASMTKMIATEETANRSVPENGQPYGKSGTRINSKESQINVRSAPSSKSAVLTVLKSGQAIQVLESKESWVRISWMQGMSPRNGWIKKTFVEGN